MGGLDVTQQTENREVHAEEIHNGNTRIQLYIALYDLEALRKGLKS